MKQTTLLATKHMLSEVTVVLVLVTGAATSRNKTYTDLGHIM